MSVSTNTRDSGIKPTVLTVLALSALLSSACSPAARQARGEEEAQTPREDLQVRRVLDGLMAADNAGDLEAAMSFYAPDALVMPPSAEPVSGRGAIRRHYEALFAASDLDLSAVSLETRVEGSLAWDRGTVRGTIAPKPENKSGTTQRVNDKYLMTLRREEDGRWLIVSLIWNSSDLPPPGGPERRD